MVNLGSAISGKIAAISRKYKELEEKAERHAESQLAKAQTREERDKIKHQLRLAQLDRQDQMNRAKAKVAESETLLKTRRASAKSAGKSRTSGGGARRKGASGKTMMKRLLS